MIKELTPAQVIFDFPKLDINKGLEEGKETYIPNMQNIYEEISRMFNIKKEGYNLYIVDSLSKEKLGVIINYLEEKIKLRHAPKDILYVTYEEEREPAPLFVGNGRGKEVQDMVNKIKDIYREKLFDFYNSSSDIDKENIIEELQHSRNSSMETLEDLAEKQGFSIKTTSSGVAFIPLKENEMAMTEKEYDELKNEEKDGIIEKASKLKEEAKNILDKLKVIEIDAVEKLKKILITNLSKETEEIKKEFKNLFSDEEEVIEYIQLMCNFIEESSVDVYNMNYEEEEEELGIIFDKYNVNVLVDNKNNTVPRIIYEEDPNLQNLIGEIEYEAHKGTYVTDMTLIKAGSILKANEGFLIIDANSLLNNPGSYQAIRKILSTGKLNFDYNRGYLELLTLNTLRTKPIEVTTKIILIGDYKLYDLLYSYDEEFKRIFKLNVEYDPVINYANSANKLSSYVLKVAENNELLPVEEGAIVEIAKHLAKKSGSKKKVVFDELEIEKLLLLANDAALNKNQVSITQDNVLDFCTKKGIEEREILEMYKDKKINININSHIVGSINGLSVIDTGYYMFGKPIRITCICTKGDGKVIDFQKENNLSGHIHEKSINILTSLLSMFIDSYCKIPVDFNLSFEQTYGKVEGDSASVAEVLCMLSALSKVPINQSIAVTGSINQFGDIQPIGGGSEKIEGFYNVCEELGDCIGKGVLIPSTNIDELILPPKIEEAIKKGDFKIYCMDSIYDAIDVMMLENKIDINDLTRKIKEQMDLFSDKKQ